MENENKKELVTLGDGNVFVKRTENGGIKAVSSRLKLEEVRGHLTNIKRKVMITAAGYNFLNRIAGLSILTPEKLTLPDGKIVANPYLIIDPATGFVEKIWVKKMVIGYGPTGNLVITTNTLLYDCKAYFLRDVIGKVQSNKNAGKICNENSLTEDEKRKGFYVRINGSIGLWLNSEDKDVIKAVDTYIDSMTFADRKAQTICEKNCMKKHPALAFNYVNATGKENNLEAYVDVIGYTYDLTREDLERLSNEENIQEINGNKIERVEVEDQVTADDIQAEKTEEEIAELPEKNETGTSSAEMIFNTKKEEVPAEIKNDNETEINEESHVSRENLFKDLKQAEDIIGMKDFNDIIQSNFGKPLERLTDAQLEFAKKLMNSKVDEYASSF